MQHDKNPNHCIGKISFLGYRTTDHDQQSHALTYIKIYDYEATFVMTVPTFRYLLIEAYYRNLMIMIPGEQCQSGTSKMNVQFWTFYIYSPKKSGDWTQLPKNELTIDVIPKNKSKIG